MSEAVDRPRLQDPLTGAYTREAFERRLVEEIDSARRYSHPLALAVIDLDHFKSINDAFGHQRGDEILRGFAERAMALLRKSDLLFRYGGDEFVLLMPGVVPAQAEEATRRLVEGMSAEPFGEAPPLTLTLSIGGAALDESNASPQALFHAADQRVYIAKRHGRNRAVWSDEGTAVRLDFDAASRLFEREKPVEILREFIDGLAERKRGVLRVSGPRGVGRSRFLHEAQKTAKLRGHATLYLCGRPGFDRRSGAVLLEARMQEGGEWQGLPDPLSESSTFIDAVRQQIDQHKSLGLLIVVDRLDATDLTSRNLLRRLLAALPVAGLMYSCDTEVGDFGSVGESVELVLAPLSEGACHLWLRTVLHWEPPAVLSRRIFDGSRGLPGLMKSVLMQMVESWVLTADGAAWKLDPAWEEFPFGEQQEAARVAGNLPMLHDDLIGRYEELLRLKEMLGSGQQITLAGPGGIGKTRLALQAGIETVQRFQDGVWFVSLASVGDVRFVASAILQAMSVVPRGATPPADALIDHLRPRSLLLVLDNFEHLTDAAGLVQRILEGAPGVRILATSRETLHLPGERVIELGGLVHGTDEATNVCGHAERLFESAARETMADFLLTPESRAAVSRICRMVEGLPLAIRLAAAWTPVYSCNEIANELERNMALLAGRDNGRGGAWSAIDYFWQQLGSAERRAVRRLASFRGGFDRASAWEVAGASPFLLAGLVAKSFLTREMNGRYGLHELLRQYAEAELERRPTEANSTRRRHAATFAAMARQAAPHWRTHEEPLWSQRMDANGANLRAALGWLLRAHDADAALELANEMTDYWTLRGLVVEGGLWFEQVLALPGAEASRHLGLALASQSLLFERTGDYPAWKRTAEAALAIGQTSGNALVEFRARSRLTSVCMFSGEREAAARHAERVVELSAALGSPKYEAVAYGILGFVRLIAEDHDGVREALRRSVQLARLVGDRRTLVSSLGNLSRTETLTGHPAAAEELLNEAAEVARLVGEGLAIGMTLVNLGAIQMDQRKYQPAIHTIEEGRRVLKESGSQEWVAIASCFIGQALTHSGEASRAARQLRQALSMGRELKAPRPQLLAMAALSRWYLSQGQVPKAAIIAESVVQHPAQTHESGNIARAVLEEATNAAGNQAGVDVRPTFDELVAQQLSCDSACIK